MYTVKIHYREHPDVDSSVFEDITSIQDTKRYLQICWGAEEWWIPHRDIDWIEVINEGE